ncbi:MAG: type II secretion system protein [Phycisphaeraceae bacterium]
MWHRHKRGFTLIELLVVVGIIGILIAVAIPAITKARQAVHTAECLSNVRSLSQAHGAFMADFNGSFVNVAHLNQHQNQGPGNNHGEGDGHAYAYAYGFNNNNQTQDDNFGQSWVHTLEPYYADPILRRSPVDDSPFWEDTGVPTSFGNYRVTSYGVNNYLARDGGTDAATRLSQVPQPGLTVHFLMMSFNDHTFATADHPHVDTWGMNPLAQASQQIEINSHGGPANNWDARSVYGFLDGSAGILAFREVYKDADQNLFDPSRSLHGMR